MEPGGPGRETLVDGDAGEGLGLSSRPGGELREKFSGSHDLGADDTVPQGDGTAQYLLKRLLEEFPLPGESRVGRCGASLREKRLFLHDPGEKQVQFQGLDNKAVVLTHGQSLLA